MKKRSVTFIVCLLFSLTSAKAQVILNKTLKEKAINELIKTIQAEYILEQSIPAITSFLQKQLKSKAYDSLNNPGDFARAVSDDLRKISNDKHIGFAYHVENNQLLDSASEEKQRDEFMRYENFGFVKAERLAANIGYVKLNDFWPLKKTKPTIDAAMAFISNSDAVILDLRDNGGGDPETVAYCCSYFINEKGKLINTIKERNNPVATEWKVMDVSGKKMITQPLYILTSNYTFSAAEEFAYDLQSLKRAITIGEPTGGGAHPVNDYPLSNNFVARIPYAKAINPYTHTNWERIGVSPDIKTPSHNALIESLKKIRDNSADTDTKVKLDAFIKTKNAENNPVCLEKSLLESYVGLYGIRTVTLENRTLFIQREGGPKFRLIPLSETEFYYDGTEARLEFNSVLKELEITMNDGRKVKARKK